MEKHKRIRLFQAEQALGDPYQITTWAQFNEIQNELTAHYLLMNDINANHVNSTVTSSFKGVFVGSGKQITKCQNPVFIAKQAM